MKKHLRKLLSLTIALIVVLSAVPVSAKTLTTVVPRKNIYIQPNLGTGESLDSFYPREKVKFSYNKKFGTVKATSKYSDGLRSYSFRPKKAGKMTITSTCSKRYSDSVKTYTQVKKYPFNILNYQNPVSSIKLGKYTLSAGKFNKTDIAYTSYNLFSKNTQTLKITPKKGWLISDIIVVNEKGKYVKSLYSSGFDDKYVGKSVSAKFRATGGKKHYNLFVEFYNAKTWAFVYSQIVFK